MNTPICTVLLATFNGEPWLPELLDSLSVQEGVILRIVASDDQSSDSTRNLLLESAKNLELSVLPQIAERFGSANRNFLRLIRDTDIGNTDFVALADQDDIWYPNKLSHAILRMKEEGVSAYSSDVKAFWPDGHTRIIKKSHVQKPFDYLFGSPGPGCTFVFKRELFLDIRTWVRDNFEELSSLWVHDWLLYAYVRANGHSWFIDSMPTMLYRQHHSNEIGANFGLKAIHRRLTMVMDGSYRRDIIRIAVLTGSNFECAQALIRLNWSDRLWLIRHAGQFRRGLFEVLVLCFIFILMPSKIDTTLS